MERCKKTGGAFLSNDDSHRYTEKNEWGTEKYFEWSTAMRANYEMHTTTLKKKGPSLAPHQHVDT